MVSILSPGRQSGIRGVLFMTTGIKVDHPELVNSTPPAVVLTKLRGKFGETAVQNLEHILAIIRHLPFLRKTRDLLFGIMKGLRDQKRTARGFQKFLRCHVVSVRWVIGHGHLPEIQVAKLPIFRRTVILWLLEQGPSCTALSIHRRVFR